MSMKKTWCLGVCLLLGTTAMVQAKEERQAQPLVSSPLEGRKWVEQCVAQHPEILWLADVDVRKTEEGQASLQGAYSEQLFGQKYVEFDRTLMTLRCMKLILDGSDQAYAAFVAAQPKETKLSREAFSALHQQGKSLLQSKWGDLSEREMAQAMEAALVLGDIGKSEKARTLLKPFGASAPDHDDFYGEAMRILEKHPELSPSFAALPSPAKDLLVRVANLAHYGHITHLEGGLEMFRHLKESGVAKDPVALAFDLFVHTCDVAGALGHVNKESSIVYTQPTHLAMQAMNDAVKVLVDPKKGTWDAYQAYLDVRATWLGLKAHDRSERVLTRLGAMLRLFTPQEGALMKKTVQEIDPKLREKIMTALDVQKQETVTRTPTYIPAVFVNFCNNPRLGNSKEERLAKSLLIGLPFITAVLEQHQLLVKNGEIDAAIPLNFNKIAGYAKESPELFQKPFAIDREGNVDLVLK